MKNKLIISKGKFNNRLIVGMFCCLPLIDTLNGIFREAPIGSIYKIMMCVCLFILLMQRSFTMKRKTLCFILLPSVYILLTIFINTALFEGSVLTLDFPVKLIFNIILMGMLLENYRIGNMNGYDFYKILDGSAWVLIFCFIVPYILGTGEKVYGEDIGYKAFFIAQNELSLILIVLCYFCIYKLTIQLKVSNFIQLALIILCGMLLNTKSTIIACLVGVAIWIVTIALKSNFKVKVLTAIAFISGFYMLRTTIFDSISAMIMRYTVLQEKYYGGLALTSVLSGRNYYLSSAFDYLNSEHTAYRILFGNGFCSEYLVEMDIIDIFFYLGLFGAVAAVLFLTVIFVKSYKNFRTDKNIIRPFSYLLIVGFINLTGHVMFMAMSGCYFIVYCCFLLTYVPDKTEIQKQVH